MNILIVGGAGYIGAHMCKRLHEAGHIVFALDNLATGHRDAVQWGELIESDLQDTATVTRILKHYRIDAVMHFAARSLVGESLADPYAYYKSNVCATLALLEAMRAADIDTLIFSSSAAIFGLPHSDRIDESHRRLPLNPYGKTKLAVEGMLEDAADAYGLRVVALRYFNAAGADASGLIGESHHPETHLIPQLLRQAAGEKMSFTIFGTDYPTPDGSCIRDYVHVSDLADAHLLALQLATRQQGFHAFNLGNGNGHSVLEIVRAVEEITGKRLDISIGNRRQGDPHRLVACSTKAREILGWQPQRPGITQILHDAWRWHRNPRY